MCFMLFFIIVIIIIVIFFFSLSFPSCLCLDLSFSLPPIFFFIPSFSFPLSPSPLPLTSSLPPFLFPSSSPFLSFHFWRFFKQAYFTMNWTIKTIYLYILDIICYFFIKRTFIEKEKKKNERPSKTDLPSPVHWFTSRYILTYCFLVHDNRGTEERDVIALWTNTVYCPYIGMRRYS